MLSTFLHIIVNSILMDVFTNSSDCENQISVHWVDKLDEIRGNL